MIVIADSSPLNYLILIDEAHVLPPLFGKVLIPKAVAGELQSPFAPPKVAAWVKAAPPWLVVQSPIDVPPDSELGKLGAGEREAILLACEQTESVLLLIDEGKGRRAASGRKIRVIGILGILEIAAERELLDLPAVVERLTRTNFFVTPNLLRSILDRHAARKNPLPPSARN